jgi:hypothetical protein
MISVVLLLVTRLWLFDNNKINFFQQVYPHKLGNTTKMKIFTEVSAILLIRALLKKSVFKSALVCQH